MRLVYVALGWGAGLVLAANAANNQTRSLLFWLLLALLASVALWLVRHDQVQRIAMLTVLALTLGGLRFSFVPTDSPVAAYNNRGGLTLTGTVTAEPDVRDQYIQLRLATEHVTFAGTVTPVEGVVLAQTPRTVDVRYGDRITATGLLIAPAEFDTFSYADYLARSGVYSIMRNAAVEVQSSGHGFAPLMWLLDIKRTASNHIRQYLPDPQAALLTGILLGNERGIAPEVGEAFQRVGAAHIVAISGFNMVILSGVVTRLFERFRWSPFAAAAGGILVISVYTILVGANVAVVRAAVMSGLLVIGTAMKRQTYVPASLALVAILMSLVNPTVLWDIGFQLSFFATLGLALYTTPLSRWFNALLARLFPSQTAARIGDFLTEPLIVTLAAQILTLPLTVLYFGSLSPVVVLVNLLIVPLQAVLLIVGLLATMIAFVSPLVAQVLYWFDLVLLSWTIGVVQTFASLPFADVAFSVHPHLIAAYFVIVLGVAMLQATQPSWAFRLARVLRRRTAFVSIVSSGVVLVVLLAAIFLSRPDGRLHVWALDVGHSNAILAQTPGGAQILVDGGRFPSRLLTAIGERLPFTDREIEVLVITQPDEFDVGALPAVLDRYDTGMVLTNGQPNVSTFYESIQQRLTGREVLAVRAGYTLEFDDGARLEVLHPQAEPGLADSLDETALVVRLVYGEVSLLFTGDLSSTGQFALLDGGQHPLATVLQLPQHGTIGSLNEQFLEIVQPQVVLLQSDSANRRGDPDPDTMALLADDLPLFRTDMGGTIHLWTDGQTIQVLQTE